MTFEEIRLAVETRMAEWVDAPVAYDGVPNGPSVQSAIDNKDAWARLSINHGTSRAPYKGSEPGIRRTGVVFVQVFTPDNNSSRQASILADSIANHFQFYRTGEIELLTASVTRIGPEDGWYRYNVSVPFRAG